MLTSSKHREPDHELPAGSAVIAGPALIYSGDRARSAAPSAAPRPTCRSTSAAEGEAVMDARIELNLTGGACSLK
jgi:hypothetical protein